MQFFKYTIFFVLLFSSKVFAASFITCPDETLIRNAGYSLNSAKLIYPSPFYSVSSTNTAFNFNNLDWKLKTSAVVGATSPGEAITLARGVIKKVTYDGWDSTETSTLYKCVYLTRTGNETLSFFAIANK